VIISQKGIKTYAQQAIKQSNKNRLHAGLDYDCKNKEKAAGKNQISQIPGEKFNVPQH
jgi:hypothetical protein